MRIGQIFIKINELSGYYKETIITAVSICEPFCYQCCITWLGAHCYR